MNCFWKRDFSKLVQTIGQMLLNCEEKKFGKLKEKLFC